MQHATWQRENLFILVDVRETMFSPGHLVSASDRVIARVYVCIQCHNEQYFHDWRQGSSQGDTGSNSSIQVLLRDCIPSLVRAKLYSGSEDDISIILYNVVSWWWMSHWLMMIFGDVLFDPRTFQVAIDQCTWFAGRARCISGKQWWSARSASMATPCNTLGRCARKPES